VPWNIKTADMLRIAIAGGGPSGAICGERLARAGLDVTIFDEHLAWEKPCGGGLTHKAIVAYPFLLDNPLPKKLIHHVELISSEGRRARLALDHPIVIYAREVLNGLLLNRAAAAGCHIVGSRVTQVDTAGGRMRMMTAGGAYEADFAVLAAGARNALLPGSPPLERGELAMTLGYFVPAQAEAIQVKFLRHFEGYIWSFPRRDHLSVGICGSMARHTSQQMRRLLEQFLRDEHIPVEGARFYSHVLPSPQVYTLRSRPITGPNWALVGDAAALVDPATGEGLYYALRSGDLLAQALLEGRPESYPESLQADFSTELEFGTRVARRLYGGRFLGAAIPTRMIQFVKRSATFRALMADLFSGVQDYAGLKRRLWMQLGTSTGEILASLFASGNPLSTQTTYGPFPPR
jgi:geranylgeranyl diphosphate/geranylgeranyl-bacteriochlorophyllide a reductase